MQSTRSKLIQLLAEYNGKYVSGQTLSDALNISRTAVWKHMRQLEKEGYKIEGKEKLGYKVIAYPNTLSEYTIKRHLNTRWLGQNIIHKETITSTQTLAHQLAHDDAPHGTVIVANEQTKGMGRRNRPWESIKNKGIWMSMILKPKILPYLAPQLTLLTATVLADVFKRVVRVEPQIKWPNDLLINDQKVAGILTEMQAEQDQIQYIIVGIGINVNHHRKDLPKQSAYETTSLLIETMQEWSLISLIQQILQSFEEQYTAYLENGFSKVKEKWESYGYKVGKRITVKVGKQGWMGTFLGIAEDGALRIQSDDGKEKKVYSGEINWFEEGEHNKC